MADAPRTFGELVYEQRRRLRMGRARLAAMVDRSPDAITRWEKEGVAPRDEDTLQALARALKLEPRILLDLAARAGEDSREIPSIAPPPAPPRRVEAPPRPSTGPGPAERPRAPKEAAPDRPTAPTPPAERPRPTPVGRRPTAPAPPPAAPAPPPAAAPAATAGPPGASKAPARVAARPAERVSGVPRPAPAAQRPARSMAPGTMMVVELPPSYRDDPREQRLYIWRYVLTGIALLIMVILLAWAARELWDAVVAAKESLSTP